MQPTNVSLPNETTTRQLRLIVVSDFFKEDLCGGAELTLDAILSACPVGYQKIRSHQLTPEYVEKNKDKYWLLVNFSNIPRDALIEIATSTKFYVIECDYKYCVYRSSHLHQLKTNTPCDCETTDHGRFIQGLFKRSMGVSFMSTGQMQEYYKRFPAMNSWPQGKLRLQSSTFDAGTLERLRKLSTSPKKPACAVLGGGSWIKNLTATERLLKARNVTYEVIGNLPPDKFLEKLSTYEGLVFYPAGFDTAPRLTIEAKLLGLNLDLNDNVQHKNEPWFTGSVEDAYAYLKDLPTRFWKEGMVIDP